jgi:proteasome lid subunit RPN8/RPN11
VNDLISLLKADELEERCGLIVDGEIIEITNIHDQPELGFKMKPEELLEYIATATASWHTHPTTDPGLSEEDYAGFTQWPRLVHHIVGVRDGKPAVESYSVIDGLVLKL